MGKKTARDLVEMLKDSRSGEMTEGEFLKNLFPESFFLTKKEEKEKNKIELKTGNKKTTLHTADTNDEAVDPDIKLSKIFRKDGPHGQKEYFTGPQCRKILKSLKETGMKNFFGTVQMTVRDCVATQKYETLHNVLYQCAKEQGLLKFVPEVKEKDDCIARLFFILIMQSIKNGPLDYLKDLYPNCPMIEVKNSDITTNVSQPEIRKDAEEDLLDDERPTDREPEKYKSTDSPRIYEWSDERSDAIYMANSRTQNENLTVQTYCLMDRKPPLRAHFYGRESLIEKIHQAFFDGNAVVFLEGIGGIGKSELAKRYAYAAQNSGIYDHVIFLTYSGKLQQTLCDPMGLVIEGVKQQPKEKDADFFNRKLQILNTVANEKTLLIVDNFDVNEDPDLKTFLLSNFRVIFTTRNAHPGYISIIVDAVKDMDALMKIFCCNYGNEICQEDRPILEEIFQLVEYHTYTIELLAKQMDASFLSAANMLQLLQNGELQEGAPEKVMGRTHQRTAFGHIQALFNTSNLSAQEKRLMMYLSLSGTEGIPAVCFKEWSEISNFETVNGLIRKSWVRKESGQRLTLHPLVRSVVHHVLKPTAKNCKDYLYQMARYCYKAWFRSYSENITVGDTVQSVLEYFTDFQGEDYLYFSCYANFLWQIGRFDAAIFYMHRVYDICVRDLGVNTVAAGFVAKALGGCYFNSDQKKKSISWYKKGLLSMLRSGAEESEDLGMCYEKVARCYTWKYEQDFAKAEELFRISLRIREKLLDQISHGIVPPRQENYEPYDINLAYDRIAEVYMEMGRMYQAKGDYEQGYEYAMKFTELMEKYRPDAVSGAAYGYYDCGVCQYHMGIALQKSGDPARGLDQLLLAEQNLKKSLNTNMKMRGTLAVDVIDNHEYLADVYVAQGRCEEASDHYLAVLNMVEQLLGKNHPRIGLVKAKMIF